MQAKARSALAWEPWRLKVNRPDVLKKDKLESAVANWKRYTRVTQSTYYRLIRPANLP